MANNHMKRLPSPRCWPIKRKNNVYIQRPNAGPRSLTTGLALGVVLRDILHIVKNMKEARYILKQGDVLVNGSVRNATSFPVGIFDVVNIKSLEKHYRGTFSTAGKLKFIEISKEQSAIVPRKIRNARLVQKGKWQLNFTDGYNLIVDKHHYKVGDTLLFDVEKKHMQHLPLKAGCTIFLISGSHLGQIGMLEGVFGRRISFKAHDGSVYETLRDYAVAVGKETAVIELGVA